MKVGPISPAAEDEGEHPGMTHSRQREAGSYLPL